MIYTKNKNKGEKYYSNMNKKILVSFIILMIVILSSSSSYAVELKDLNITAKEVGIYELKNLNPIYEKDARKQVPVASLTKIMTAIVCLENVDINKKVVVDLPAVKKYYDEEYSVAGLKDKQEISYLDLVETMLLPSGADSGACIALNVFNDYDKFIQAMNKKAKELGMNNTSFSNVIGMDDKNNYSTVEDMAIMMKYAMENEYIRYGITQYSHTIKDGSKTVHNALFQLADLYAIDISNITGGKTGFTGDAGYCLLSYSETTPEPLICIVLGCEVKPGTLYHLSETEAIFELINENYSEKDLVSEGDVIVTLPAIKSTKEEISIQALDSIQTIMKNDEKVDKDAVEIRYEGIDVLSPENKVGKVIGKIDVYYKGKYIGSEEVKLTRRVPLDLKIWVEENPAQAGLFAVLIAAGLILIIRVGVKIYKKKQIIHY